MKAATAWRLCAVAGLATLAVSTAFGSIAGLKPCGPSGGAGAILAFELARTPEQLALLFGLEPCKSQLMAAQRSALWLDLLAFIPAYSAFLAFAGLALRSAAPRLATAAIVVLLTAGLLDWIEGLVMFGILDGFPGSPWQFEALFWTVRPKFALLAIGEMLLALLLLRHGWIGRIAAIPVMAGGAIAFVLLLANPYLPLMMRSHSYGWTTLLIVALIASVRPSLVQSAKPA